VDDGILIGWDERVGVAVKLGVNLEVEGVGFGDLSVFPVRGDF